MLNRKIKIAVILLLLGIFTSGVYAGDENQITKGNNEFAINLYSQIKNLPEIKQAEGNLFFSPYSISIALAMTYTGARGNTAKEMADVLCLPAIGLEQVISGFGSLQKKLQDDTRKGAYQLDIANALWVQKGYPFLSEFVELNKKYFGSGLNELDFDKVDEARKIINTWFEEQTNEKIKGIIGPGIVASEYTRLILTNVIYFKGSWVSPFMESMTKPANFKVSESKTVEVPMMYQEAERFIGYVQTDDVQLLQMPYGPDERVIRDVLIKTLDNMESVKELRNQIRRGDSESLSRVSEQMRKINDEQRQKIQAQLRRLSMLIILPKTISDLDSVESKLNPQTLQSYINQIKQQEVKVYLPKFKIGGGTIELKSILNEMGMKDAFNPDTADFTGMSSREKLNIYAALHKSYVIVDEKGTEAGSATVVMAGGGISLEKPPVPVFRADRPFIFMIRDNITGSILFMGRVVDPTLKSE